MDSQGVLLASATVYRVLDCWSGAPPGRCCALRMAGPRGGHVLAAATAVAAAVALLALIRRRRHLQGPLIDADLDGTWPLPLAQPEAVGLSTQRLSEISRWSDGWVGSGKLPGLFTAIARRGKLVYAHSSGSADVASGSPLTQHTLVRLYSLTKPLVSVCAMVLYEKGLFQLDEPVSHHLPSFANARVLLASGEIVPAEREVTVHHLLTHTAGLTYGDSDTAVDEAYKAAGCGWDAPYHLSLSDFVDRIGRLPLAFHPGESWRYSYATDVLGRLLEVISGLPLDRLMDETLFSPLGMADSGFVVPPEKLPRFAAIYEASEAPGRVGAVARQRRRFERGGSFATLLWSLRRSANAGSEQGSDRGSCSDRGRGSDRGSGGVSPMEGKGAPRALRLFRESDDLTDVLAGLPRESRASTSRTSARVAVVSCAARPGPFDSALEPRSRIRTLVSQPAPERTRIQLYSPVFRCINGILLGCIHAVL